MNNAPAIDRHSAILLSVGAERQGGSGPGTMPDPADLGGGYLHPEERTSRLPWSA